eukprot:6274325-Prymnesium_polylepis.1
MCREGRPLGAGSRGVERARAGVEGRPVEILGSAREPQPEPQPEAAAVPPLPRAPEPLLTVSQRPSRLPRRLHGGGGVCGGR